MASAGGQGKEIFAYWTTNSNGTGTKYNPGDNIVSNADIDLWAQWKHQHITADSGVTDPADNYEATTCGGCFTKQKVSSTGKITYVRSCGHTRGEIIKK